MEKEIKDKAIAVTGGAQGIGYQIAHHFLKHGAAKVIVLDILENSGIEAVKTLNEEHGPEKAVFFKCDVTRDLETVSSEILSKYKIDVFVNNAGVLDETSLRKTMEINVIAVVEWGMKFWNYMRKNNGGFGGTIINIASIYGYVSDPWFVYYKTSKHAVMGFTKTLGHSYNYEKTGVRVFAVCPGFTDTKLLEKKELFEDTEEVKKFLETRYLQKVETVGQAAVDIFKVANSGTAWWKKIMIIFIIWIAVLIAVFVIYLRQKYSRFNKYGIKYITPLPVLGNTARVLLRLEHFAYDSLNLYNKFPEERFVGRFEFTNEMVVIRDLDLVKQITVKDFEHFLDHRSLFGESSSFLSRNLISLKGQEWKDMRSTLSPAFTSSKIRVMIPFMVEVGDQMIAMLKKKLKESKTGCITVDCKDLTTRYANDVIASCAFGLKVDSHTDIDNQFYARGKEALNFGFRQIMLFLLMINMPNVAKHLKWDFLSQRSKDFFRDLVMNTMKDRELKHVIRPDMIHLLMEAKKGRLTHDTTKPDDVAAGFATVEESAIGAKEINKEWTDNDLIAQAVLFFLAGFETVSSGMCFLLFELAANPDVQDRLAKEIKDHDLKNGGKFDLNSMQSMTYLDMVISELLRLWPPLIALDRECTKDYNLGRPNKHADRDFIIRKGSGVQIPVFAFHRDPQYFPNPDKFDPERFSEENKHNIHPLKYMPFGIGPRNCIGSRFALCEMKAITYQLLLHMEISPCETTCLPPKFSPESFNLRIQGGHDLRFRLRA
ncbi:unnamed protein product [Arctia plantaginis]|uniref:unspecific monooxygenase n=1 Tax=Arctia plantaginis TaxID=874455 RepID=A0A8S1A1C6_ARCPL|nr:unnamed protein product [Arctia plantaginis]